MIAGWVVPVLAGLYGLLIGSFLNVCSLRWPMDESVIRPRSRCPNCETLIAWYDNVPLVSWIVLGGKCRSCATPVSIQYPLVELATALLWAGAFSLHGPSWEALRGSILLTIVFGISISDARFYIIPDQFSVGGAMVGLGMAFLPGGIDWIPAFIGAALGYAVLWFVGAAGTWLIKRLSPGRLEEAGVDHAMGGGDIKMMMMIGAFLGPWGVALSVFLGSFLALLVFGPISAISKRLIPLGVFLAAGGGVAYVCGDAMLRWYMTTVVGSSG